ncbi:MULTISPECIES: ABC transporter ATP-binding protein [unclassified Granulicatella]|uniref:ABC transporter ATP-binding protein n=1 Tax=unclassified Granulicatella TaxID=2630493 RepID=UPI0010740DC9|nr:MULTISPECIES: ABC transporter ATP-binding protein [unclassified Granulicatella]MBF0779677.1 ABC transporter ATP-binding protein [Granulicatella sp. 19428wC4_WM01]TFU96331.1 ABC transporter ATP-binding protein [Granulicatella sp. WM01]
MIKRILPYFKKYKKYPFFAMIAILIEVLCEVIQPVIVANIIDKGVSQKNLEFIVQQGLLMVGLSIIALIAGMLGAKFASLAGTNVASELRRAEMAKIQGFSFHNIDYFSNASLVTRLSSDVTSVQNTIIMTLRILSRAPLMLFITIFLVVQINAPLSLVLIIAVPFLVLALALILSIAFPRFKKLQQAVDSINRTLQENFIGIRVVKSFVREDYEREKFNAVNTTFKERALRAMMVVIFNGPAMQLAIYACTIAVMWYGGNMAIAGGITNGELISFLSYITQIFMSLMMMSFVFIMFTMTKASMDRIFEVLDTEIDIVEKTHAQSRPHIQGDVSFEHVYFSYGKDQTEEALSDIHFDIKAGQVFGIIGPTGSGKTSLVQLIPRLFDTTKGCVKVGGVDVKEFTFKDLRQHVSMVLQKNTLFSGTIRENLLWGNEQASEDDLIQAAKYAQAHDFIMEMPDGYDTWVEQGGGNFSGGQKQRLCIARAMVRKPAVLILDDSTSAVDTATDSHIREAFFNHFPDTTVIIIAQRISSIQGADNILVLEDGKMSALGNHEMLLENSDMYRDIYETQMKGAQV